MTVWPLRLRGTGGDRRATVLVLGGLVAFVLGVYAVVVVGGGWLLGRTSLPGVALSVLATAVVALAYDTVRDRLGALVRRGHDAAQPAPFDVLRRFSASVSGRYAVEDVPAEMARVLAEGTGAACAEVWLNVRGELTLAAHSPAAPAGHQSYGVEGERHSLDVRHAGELLGVLVVQERPHVPLTAVEERLFEGLAAQAGLALRAAALRTQLEDRARELTDRAEELRRSRRRLVDAQDDERRRLERDIHDGAQQHLVALAVNLRLAQTLAASAPDRAVTALDHQVGAAREAVDTLVRLTRGIYPSLLRDRGLVAALEAAAELSAVPVRVTAVGVDRLPDRVEAAAYFCCTEALQNAATHAEASVVHVEVCRTDDDQLVLTVSDDGSGFDARADRLGTGLANMRERVEAVDGTLEIGSGPAGTRLVARFPLRGEG